MFYADRVGLPAILRTRRRVPREFGDALGAGAAAGTAGARGQHVPRARHVRSASIAACVPHAFESRVTIRADRPHRGTACAGRDASTLRSPHPLGPYPAKHHRAARPLGRSGHRTARSSPSATATGAWRRLTYGEALARVRSHRPGAARPRPLAGSARRHPLGQQHRARAARRWPRCTPACRTRRSRRPIRCWRASTARCARSVDDACSPDWSSPPTARASSARSPAMLAKDVELVTSHRRRTLAATAVRRARSHAGHAAVDEAHARVDPRHDREGPVHVGLDRAARRASSTRSGCCARTRSRSAR